MDQTQEPTAAPALSEPASSFAPAPASPAEVPETVAPELPQEEMMANLEALMAKIEDSYQQFGPQKFAVDKQAQDLKSQAMRQLFDLLQSKGIDPNDPEAVGAYLDQIKSDNPELYQQVEQALELILGSDQGAGAPSPDNMNMNPNEDVSQNL